MEPNFLSNMTKSMSEKMNEQLDSIYILALKENQILDEFEHEMNLRKKGEQIIFSNFVIIDKPDKFEMYYNNNSGFKGKKILTIFKPSPTSNMFEIDNEFKINLEYKFEIHK